MLELKENVLQRMIAAVLGLKGSVCVLGLPCHLSVGAACKRRRQ